MKRLIAIVLLLPVLVIAIGVLYVFCAEFYYSGIKSVIVPLVLFASYIAAIFGVFMFIDDHFERKWALERKLGGDDCDIQQWERLLKFIEKNKEPFGKE